MFNVIRMTDYSFLLEDEKGVSFPADFLNRQAAETACIALNRLESSRHEPIRIVLDKPEVTPGRSQPSKVNKISVGSYAQKPQKQLVIAVRDEKPPQTKPKIKITL